MKRIKAMNGYTIYQYTQKDFREEGHTVGEYAIYFSSDIRDFGLSNSYSEYDDIETLEICEELCSGTYAIAKELCEAESTCVTLEDIEEKQAQIDSAKGDKVALMVTQYERVGSVGRDEYIEYYINEELSVDEGMIGFYNEYLSENGYESYWNDLEEMTYGMDTMEVVRACFYGHNFNPYADYFRFNGYANIDGFSEWEVIREMKNDTDFLEWYVENYADIDECEIEEHVENANILIRLGY